MFYYGLSYLHIGQDMVIVQIGSNSYEVQDGTKVLHCGLEIDCTKYMIENSGNGYGVETEGGTVESVAAKPKKTPKKKKVATKKEAE